MFPRLSPGEQETGRARPARRARWRRYLAPAGLTVAGLVATLAPPPLIERIMASGITLLGALILTAAAGVLLTTTLVGVLSTRPLATLLPGSLMISLGANVLPARWIALPLLALGLLWTCGMELHRLLSGVVLTNRHVVLMRPLRPGLWLSYDEVRVAHTTGDAGAYGALILESDHGTVTATHLPEPGALAERIHARKSVEPVEEDPHAVSETRARIGQLLSGKRPDQAA